MTPIVSVESPTASLELRINNPYSTGYIFVFPEGDSLLQRDPIPINHSVNDQYYIFIEGDTLESIAFNKYGDSKYWWIIYDVNDIDFPLQIPIGTVLLIPDINQINIAI